MRTFRNNKGAIANPLMKKVGPIHVIGILLIAAIILVASGTVNVDKMRSELQLFSVTGGGSLGGSDILTSSPITYTSNDPFVNGPAWLVYLKTGGGAQKLSGLIDVSQISDPVAAVKAQHGFLVDLTLNSESCNYRINSYGKGPSGEIYTLSGRYFPLYGVFSPSCSQKAYDTAVQGGPGTIYWWYYTKPLTSLRNNCAVFVTAPKGIKGGIENTGTSWSATMGFTNLDTKETQTAQLNSQGPTNVNIGNIGTLTYQGSLVSGGVCPDATAQQKVGVYDYTKSSWKIASATTVNTYNQLVPAGVGGTAVVGGAFYDCLNRVGIDSAQAVSNCVNMWNGRANQIFSETVAFAPATGGLGAQATYASGSSVNGSITIPLQAIIQYPTFTARIKAAWLGVVSNVGKPVVTNVQEPGGCFQSGTISAGTKGILTADIWNDATVPASFSVSATCQAPIQVQGTAIPISLGPNETTPVNFILTGQADKNTTVNCVVTATDRYNPSLTTSSTGQACVSPQIAGCTPGKFLCSGGTIVKCTDSAQYDVFQKCGTDEVCSLDGGAHCESTNGGGTGWLDKLANWLRNLFPQLSFLGPIGFKVLAALIFAFGVYLAFTYGKVGGAEFILALVAGVLAGIMTLSVTWFFVATLGVYLLIKYVLKLNLSDLGGGREYSIRKKEAQLREAELQIRAAKAGLELEKPKKKRFWD